MTQAPAGVNPALWAEFQQLSGHVHELLSQRQDAEDGGAPAPPMHRLIVNLTEEQLLFFAWLAGRKHRQRHGKDGPTGLAPDTIQAHATAMREAVRAYLEWLINEDFHGELHQLATGVSPWLRPADQSPSPRARAISKTACLK